MLKSQKKLTLTYILLSDIAMAMNNGSYEMEWYLDIEKEECTFLSEYDEEMNPISELIINDEEEERFIPIPMRGSRKGWEQMERFILSLEDDIDETVVRLLHNTIQGRGAFARFKEAIYTAGVEERWFEFSNREDTEEVLDWLYSIDLINEEDKRRGMELFKEWQAKRGK